jgi:hypothetical protein
LLDVGLTDNRHRWFRDELRFSLRPVYVRVARAAQRNEVFRRIVVGFSPEHLVMDDEVLAGIATCAAMPIAVEHDLAVGFPIGLSDARPVDIEVLTSSQFVGTRPRAAVLNLCVTRREYVKVLTTVRATLGHGRDAMFAFGNQTRIAVTTLFGAGRTRVPFVVWPLKCLSTYLTGECDAGSVNTCTRCAAKTPASYLTEIGTKLFAAPRTGKCSFGIQSPSIRASTRAELPRVFCSFHRELELKCGSALDTCALLIGVLLAKFLHSTRLRAKDAGSFTSHLRLKTKGTGSYLEGTLTSLTCSVNHRNHVYIITDVGQLVATC